MSKIIGTLSIYIDVKGMNIRDFENYVDDVEKYIAEKALNDYCAHCEVSHTDASMTIYEMR